VTTYTCYACDTEFEVPTPATQEDEAKLFDADHKGKLVVICEECLEWSLIVNAWEKAAHMLERLPN
jgi:hypothetical protein